MNKVYFTRKAVNIDELKGRTGEERDKQYFVVEKVIELPADQWEHFKENLLDDVDFIEVNAELMFADKYDVWHCILIKAIDGTDGILCEAEGYGYCRYGAYVSDCSSFLEETEGNITDKIQEQILAIRDSGVVNMFDIVSVQREVFDKGFNELVVLIKENKKEYVGFIFNGKK